MREIVPGSGVSDEKLIMMPKEKANSFIEKNLSKISYESAMSLLEALLIYNRQQISNKNFNNLLDVVIKKHNPGTGKDGILFWYCMAGWETDVGTEKKLLEMNCYVLKEDNNTYGLDLKSLRGNANPHVVKKILLMAERVNTYLKIQKLRAGQKDNDKTNKI